MIMKQICLPLIKVVCESLDNERHCYLGEFGHHEHHAEEEN